MSAEVPNYSGKDFWEWKGDRFTVLPAEVEGLFLGKILLTGITYKNRDGEVVKMVEFWGAITTISLTVGIEMTNPVTNAVFSLPPDLASLYPAEPGEYRLRSTGEVVVDPDYLSTWERNSP